MQFSVNLHESIECILNPSSRLLKFVLFFGIIIFFPSQGTSQFFATQKKAEPESYKSEIQQFRSPENAYKFIETLLSSAQDTTLIIANAYQKAAQLHIERKQYSLAINDEQNALKIQEKILGSNHASVAYSNWQLGELYLENQDYSSASHHLNAAYRLFANLKQRETIPITSQLISVYLERNQLDSAILLIDQTLDLAIENGLGTTTGTGRLLIEKGSILAAQNRHQAAQEIFSKSVKQYEADCTNTYKEEQLITAYQLLSREQAALNAPIDALESLQQALLINQERKDLTENRIELLLNYQELVQTDTSLLGTTALSEIEQLVSTLNEDKQIQYLHILQLRNARQLINQGEFKQGVKQFQEALENHIPVRVSSPLPKPDQVTFASNKDELVIGYLELTDILKQEHQKKANRDLLRKAFTTIKLADQLVLLDLKKRDPIIDAKIVSNVYRTGAELAHQLDRPDEAWYFHERLKATRLQTQYPIKKIEKWVGIPDSLQQKRKILDWKRDSLEQLVLPLKVGGKYYALGKHIEVLEALKVEQEQFEERIRSEFPNFHKFCTQFDPVNLETIRDYLADNGAELISYVVTDSSVLAMQVDNWKKKLFTFSNHPEIKEKAEQYHELMTRKSSDLGLIDSIGQALYNHLFKPMAHGKKRVFLSTDQWLRQLPFEALVTPPKHKKPLEERWLVRQKQISYSSSLGLRMTEQNESTNHEGMLVVAPWQFPASGKPPLKQGKQLVTYLLKSFKADSLLDKQATVSQFIEGTKNRQAVHLTTHVEQFPTPRIHLSNDVFVLDSLLTEEHKCALWVLSHLEWDGLDKHSVSAHDYLQLHGIEGIVSPLWRSEMGASNTFLQSFYTGLISGKGQAEALQKAKLEIIKAGRAHPYHWAGYCHYGHSDKVRATAYDGPTYIIAAFFILILVVWTMGYTPKKE